ncbi:MAG: ABC transporter ATP-binding protein [Hyphomicrobiales bacterium]|nr:ABC transporter ATP-binding protein [Hyphomicrobiales bacterium]
MDRMVEITNVTKTFGDITAVDAATLSVDRGDFLTIVGPSGCGKTTLLRMVAGFETPSTGDIRIHGKQVADVPAYRRSIGMVFQKLALFPHMTAAQNVAYPLKMRRFDPKEIPGRVERYLDLVKLGGLGDRRPHELSGGQQQRVAIARALSFSPDLLLLDEPLSALDKKLREEMQLEFRRIQQELGVTTINVTHDQREALVMSDHIVVMNDGVVQQADTPVALYREPGNRFVANFIGVTSMFPATVKSVDGSPITVQSGSALLKARANGEVLALDALVECAIRAEQIRILDGDSDAFDNRVEGTVEQRIFEGDRVVYAVRVEDLADSILYVFDHDPEQHNEYPVGGRVHLGWNARDLFAFPSLN